MVDLACEPFRVPSCRAALHVDDLVAADGEYLVALLARPVLVHPLCRADDHVVADTGELGLDVDSTVAAFANLEGQDRTGLVGAASGGCAFPPQVAVRDAAPLALLGDQVGERTGVAPI